MADLCAAADEELKVLVLYLSSFAGWPRGMTAAAAMKRIVEGEV